MKPWLAALVFGGIAAIAAAVPPTSPNAPAQPRPTPPGAARSPAADYAATVEKSRRKTEFFLVRAELTVDARGWPKQVRLLNPTGDGEVDRKLARQLKRSRFTPPKGSGEPTAGTFTVTTRVQVDS